MANERIELVSAVSNESLDLIASMDVYLIIRRKKVTLHLEVVEDTKILTIKKMIENMFKVQPEDQQLFLMFVNSSHLDKYQELSDSNAVLSDCGLISSAATVIEPAVMGLAVRQKDGSFEKLKITPYSDSQWSKPSSTPPTDDEMQKFAIYREKYARMWKKLHGTNPSSSTSSK